MNVSADAAWSRGDVARQARVDLAACHRLAARFGLNEGIDNHLTMLVPGFTDRFYLAPFGLLWSEVKASASRAHWGASRSSCCAITAFW